MTEIEIKTEQTDLPREALIRKALKDNDSFLLLLSERARNVCLNAHINTLEELEIFSQKRSFEEIRNCGVKTARELYDLLQIAESFFLLDDSTTSRNAQIEYSDLSNFQKKMLELELEVWRTKLSNGAISTLLKASRNAHIDLKLIFDLLQDPNKLHGIRGAGEKKIIELSNFLTKVAEHIHDILSYDIDELTLFLEGFKNKYNLSLKQYTELREKCASQSVDLIEICNDYLIENNAFLDDRKKHAFGIIFSPEGGPILQREVSEIARLFGVSKQTIRNDFEQVKINAKKTLSFLSDFIPYSTIANKQMDSYIELADLITDNPLKYNYLANDQATLHMLLYYTIPGSKFSKFDVFPSTRVIDLKKRLNQNIGFYLINNSQISAPKINSFVESILLKLEEQRSIKEQYSIKSNLQSMNEAELVLIRRIINFHLGLDLNRNDELSLDPNSFVKLGDLIESFLEELKEPQSLEEIYDGILNRFGKTSKSVDALRGTIINDNRFTYFRGGGTSKYGLTRWTTELDIKDGSITNIILEYLEQFDTPVHYYEVFKHVKEHRDVIRSNIYALIQMNASGRFKMFDGGFIGLAEKSYDDDYISLLHEISPSYSKAVFKYVQDKAFLDTRLVINLFSQKYNLFPIQIEYLLFLREEKGEIIIEGNKIKVASGFEETIPAFDDSNEEPHQDKVISTKLTHEELFSKVLEILKFEIKHDGNNPYKLQFRGIEIEIFVLNISSAYFTNKDVTRIQIPKHKEFQDNNLNNPIIPIGYDSENEVFVIWDPFDLAERLNDKENISLYSKTSIQQKAASNFFIRTINKESKHFIAFRQNYLPAILFQTGSFFKTDESNRVLIGELLTTEEIRQRFLSEGKSTDLLWHRNFCEYERQWFCFHQFESLKEYNDFLDSGEIVVRMDNSLIKREFLKLVITKKVHFFIKKNFDHSKGNNRTWEYVGKCKNILNIADLTSQNLHTSWKPQVLIEGINFDSNRPIISKPEAKPTFTAITQPKEKIVENYLDTNYTIEEIRQSILKILGSGETLTRREIKKELKWQDIRLQNRQLGAFLYRHMRDELDKTIDDRWYVVEGLKTKKDAANLSVDSLTCDANHHNLSSEELKKIETIFKSNPFLAFPTYKEIIEQKGINLTRKEIKANFEELTKLIV